jgi:hypothetical protein
MSRSAGLVFAPQAATAPLERSVPGTVMYRLDRGCISCLVKVPSLSVTLLGKLDMLRISCDKCGRHACDAIGPDLQNAV